MLAVIAFSLGLTAAGLLAFIVAGILRNNRHLSRNAAESKAELEAIRARLRTEAQLGNYTNARAINEILEEL